MRTKTLMFLITYTCNLRCSYCYEPKVSAHRISKDHLRSLIRQKVEALPESYDSFDIHFMGGEPLLEFDLIRDVSEWLWTQRFGKKLGMVFAPTNGTLMDDERKRWFRDNRNRICLGLSFDGDLAMQNVNRSGSAQDIDLDFFSQTWPEQNVKMTLSPATVASLYDGVTFLHSKGFKRVDAELAKGESVGWTRNDLKVLSEQLSRLSQFYVDHRQYELSMLDFDIFALSYSGSETSKICSCGEHLTCVDVDGREYACHLFSPVAMPREKADESRKIDFSCHENFRSEKCDNCRLRLMCTRCYGMSFMSSGNVNTTDPIDCASFKIIYIANCRHQLRLAEAFGDMKRKSRIKNLVNCLIN